MMVGQALRGIFDPFCLIPSLPEMIDAVVPLYPKSMEPEINDAASGIFNMFLGIGQITGPLFGSFMVNQYDFVSCTDSVAIISLTFGVIYFLFGGGCQAFRRSKWSDVPTSTTDYDRTEKETKIIANDMSINSIGIMDKDLSLSDA